MECAVVAPSICRQLCVSSSLPNSICDALQRLQCECYKLWLWCLEFQSSFRGTLWSTCLGFLDVILVSSSRITFSWAVATARSLTTNKSPLILYSRLLQYEVVQRLHCSQVVQRLHCSQVVQRLHCSQVVQRLHCSQVVQRLHCSQVVQRLHCSQVVQRLHCSQVVQRLHCSQVVQRLHCSQVVQRLHCSQVVQRLHCSQVVQRLHCSQVHTLVLEQCCLF